MLTGWLRIQCSAGHYGASPPCSCTRLQCEHSNKQNCHSGQNQGRNLLCNVRYPLTKQQPVSEDSNRQLKTSSSLNKTNRKKLLVENSFIFFWFTVSTFLQSLYICVTHSHAIACLLSSHSISHAPHSLSNNTHNALPHKAHCQWAEPELWRPHLCVREWEWEDALLSSANVLLLSRVVQMRTHSHSHTNSDIRDAQTAMHET